MSQSKMMKRWTPRYFVLDNGFLSHYEKKSLVGTKKHKVWHGSVRFGTVWFDVGWGGMTWYGMVGYGTAWYGKAWCSMESMVWYSMVDTVHGSNDTYGIREQVCPPPRPTKILFGETLSARWTLLSVPYAQFRTYHKSRVGNGPPCFLALPCKGSIRFSPSVKRRAWLVCCIHAAMIVARRACRV